MSINQLNKLIRKHTSFAGALDLIKSARFPYRPTLYCHSAKRKNWRAELTIIADFYDAAMQRRGINKQAYRV